MTEEQEKNDEQEFRKEPYIPLVSRKGVGRNDPCPCDSGLKYKNCHEKADKGLLPTELRHLLQGMVVIVGGVTIPQYSFDNVEDNEITISFNENKQAWDILPVRKKEPTIALLSKDPVIQTRKIIKLN